MATVMVGAKVWHPPHQGGCKGPRAREVSVRERAEAGWQDVDCKSRRHAEAMGGFQMNVGMRLCIGCSLSKGIAVCKRTECKWSQDTLASIHTCMVAWTRRFRLGTDGM